MRCSTGPLLSDDMIIEIVQTCFRMSIQMKFSGTALPSLSLSILFGIVIEEATNHRHFCSYRTAELLRRTAEQTLLEMYQTVFLGALKNLRLVREPPQEVCSIL